MIICFVNQKGGVGKTTAAINLAVSLRRKNNRVVFIDADPQGSASQWHAVEDNEAFELLHLPEPVEMAAIEMFSRDYDHVIIDAPPAIGEITHSILHVADLVIIPVSPSPLDIWSCSATLELIKEVQAARPELQVKLLINRKIPGTRVGRDARQAVEVFQYDIFDTELCQRVAYIDSLTSGVSVTQYASASKAADEIESLCDEIVQITTTDESTSGTWNSYSAPAEDPPKDTDSVWQY